MLGIRTVTNLKSNAKGRNELLRELKDFKYIFLVRDYVKVLDPTVYARFVLTSQKTGFECMGLASYEPSNQKIIYTRDSWVDYWQYPSSDFLFFTQNAIQKAGYLNENFPSDTWEDVEHIKRVGDLGLTAPFGYFVGIKNERRYLSVDIEVKQKQTLESIKRHNEFKKATEYWQSLNVAGFPDMPSQDKMEIKNTEGAII
jgi:hypothetical protein